ncbi:B93 [Murid betaherpesvirus 8]|uniref:B93 n=1 Tax=Rat cytomegalovirus (isolate England) TaxID=1261657 RepID=A0A0E3SY88_RCMVE|nr:B93 [Murid betaherpesvirus 8]WPH25002.1 B93 [Murid betaherpesvirus 8]WPH25136.1 B93 [Murid betaherpesvirus 8]
METHLRFESDLSTFDVKQEIPVHIIFTQETLSYEEFQLLKSISFKIISKETSQWRQIRYFERIDREFRIRSLMHEKSSYLSAAPGSSDVVIHGGDEKCRFGVVFSVFLCVSDVNWFKDVIKFMLCCMNDSVIEVDCTFVRMVKDGIRFFCELKRSRLKAADGIKGAADEGGDRLDEKGALSDVDPDIPVGVSLSNDDFFDLRGERKMSSDMEGRLSRFAIKRVSATDFGPLEPPSKIRGYESRQRRGRFLENGGPVVVSEPQRTRTDRWFSSDNVVRISHVQEVLGVRRFLVVWYSESCGVDVSVTATKLDDSEAAVVSFEHTRRWEKTITRIYADASRELIRTINLEPKLPQRFYVNLCSRLDHRRVVDLLWLSRDVWLVSATGSGCIIKALSSNLYHRRRNDDCGGWRVCWADVIWYAQGRVVSGVPVKLMRVGGDGLWRSYFNDNTLTDWELNPEICVIYAFGDGGVFWVLPGGFCVSFELRVDDGDVETVREKFSQCQEIHRTGL